ncbi:hypothetical protein GQ53DRAFT_752768 [Thozetella sp. PMI_491]|nr:hypothetical protein GQ53DRAFT_752768 [Thozetella sp. PMI_491]
MPSRSGHHQIATGSLKNAMLIKKLQSLPLTPPASPRLGKRTRLGPFDNQSDSEEITNYDYELDTETGGLVLAARTWGGPVLPHSPPLSPVDTNHCELHTDRDHDGTQSPAITRQRKSTTLPKKTSDPAPRKAQGGRIQSRNQRRRGSRRSGGGGGDEDSGDDDSDGSDSGRDRDADDSTKSLKKPLACPFYKFNSMRYMSCVRLRMTRIRDVKQHLTRRHRRPPHCPMCGITFTDSQRWEQHILARNCDRPPSGFHIEGVSETQSIALARRVNRSHDEAKQWFSIWEILFPTLPPPPSPYLSNHFEETLGMVYEFWQQHRDGIVRELGGNQSCVATLSSQIVQTLLERFRARSQTVMDPATSNPTALEPSSSVSPDAVVETPPMFSCPIDLSMALSPHNQRRGQRLLQQDSNIHFANSGAYAVPSQGVSNSQSTIGFSQNIPGTVRRSAIAVTMPTQTLSPFSMDTSMTPVFSQTDVAMAPDDLIDSTPVPGADMARALPGPDKPREMGSSLMFIGAWENPQHVDADNIHRALYPTDQEQNLPMTFWSTDIETSGTFSFDHYEYHDMYQQPPNSRR